MSALVSFDKPLKVHSSCNVSCHIISFYGDVNQIKPPQNGNLKKLIISLYRSVIHMAYDPYFPKGVLNTNENCKCDWPTVKY